ncbi:MAG: DUF2953 domain-containing protein, partial [Clostridia bacterium]|nr:DUF2953 domain-containing protein [Clostridia bacterium]
IASFFANKCIVIDELKIYLKFGTGDAAQTGVATGILNTLAYSITGAVHQNVRLKKWSVDIVPEFEKENFEFQFLCIGTTRLLHIINVGIKALKLYKKFKTI